MAHIIADKVSLRFPIYDVQAQNLRNHVVEALKGRRNEAEGKVVHVFDDISFSFGKGDRVAVLGKNGAGKSSMLRMIAGVYAPWRGDFYVQGRVGALFELGSGMDVDHTARENIQRSGILNGIPRASLDAQMADLEELVDIGEFFDRPVRSYSSGMVMRAAFAMSTILHPEILVIDEVFGAGDFEFQERAQKRMESLIDGAEILVFASHSMDLVRRLCNKGLLIEDHKLTAMGPVDEVIDAYMAS